LEVLGVPTVAVVTEPFAGLARQAAEAYSLPDARIVVIDHPLGGIGAGAVEAIAAAAVDRVIKLLIPPEEASRSS
jgi:hypothetical protein